MGFAAEFLRQNLSRLPNVAVMLKATQPGVAEHSTAMWPRVDTRSRNTPQMMSRPTASICLWNSWFGGARGQLAVKPTAEHDQ